MSGSDFTRKTVESKINEGEMMNFINKNKNLDKTLIA